MLIESKCNVSPENVMFPTNVVVLVLDGVVVEDEDDPGGCNVAEKFVR
jgi:hypothetical protein